MKAVYHASLANGSKAEELLKKDDQVSRGSITLVLASSLGIKEAGYFIIVDADENVLAKADQLLQDVAKRYEQGQEVLNKLQEQEQKAMEGFGSILG
ncbi:MAG: hypothetical protein HY519_02015 [Candidatus Aenigmarchaeota archaeon]|nr:hypothetical protein [Candidatus Aenigmarchaeota archaeon]